MCDLYSRLVVVSGPSGAGKDTVVAKLLEKAVVIAEENEFTI